MATLALGDLHSCPTPCRVGAGEGLRGLPSSPARCVHPSLCSAGWFLLSPSPHPDTPCRPCIPTAPRLLFPPGRELLAPNTHGRGLEL